MAGPWEDYAPTDSAGFAIDTSRPKLQNADGSFSTEETITVQFDDRHYNIPTIWNGKRLSHAEAIARAAKELRAGKTFPNFATLDEATSAAAERSATIGQVRGEREPGPWEDYAPQPTSTAERGPWEDYAPGAPAAGSGFITGPLQRGWQRAMQAGNVLTLEIGLEDPSSAAADIAQRQTNLDALGTPDYVRAAQERARGKGILGSAAAYAQDPRAVVDVSLESLATSLASLTTGAAGGAAFGLPGFVLGTGAGSFATEYGTSILEALQETGVNLADMRQVQAALGDPAVMATAREFAVRRGVPVAAFDALSAGMAGRLLKPVARMAGGGVRGNLAGGAAEVTQQALLGGTGEATGQVAAKGEIYDPAGVALEAIGELPSGAVETATGALTARRGQTTGQTANRTDTRRFREQLTEAGPWQDYAQAAPQAAQAAPAATPTQAPTPAANAPQAAPAQSWRELPDGDVELTLKDEKYRKFERALAPEARRTLVQMRQDAEAYLPSYTAEIKAIQDAVAPGAGQAVTAFPLLEGQYAIPGLKGWDRIAEKLVAEEGGNPNALKDFVRSTILVRTPQEAQAALDAVLAKFGEAKGTLHRRSLLDGLPDDFGYADIKVNIPGPNGRIYEVQITTPELFDLKEKGGHKFYEDARGMIAKANAEGRIVLSPDEVKRYYELGSQAKQHYSPGYVAFFKPVFEEAGRPSRLTTAPLAGTQPSAVRSAQEMPSGPITNDRPSISQGTQPGPGTNVDLALSSTASPPAPSIARSPLPRGSKLTTILANGERIPARFAVVEADQLLSSDQAGYPADMQPRQRDERAASDAQVRKIVEGFEPAYLGEQPEAQGGSPVVTADGTVLSGNGRVMALRQVYQANDQRAEAYRAHLTSLGYDIGGLRNPVLVRVPETALADPRGFVVGANKPVQASMSATETALTDAELMTPEVLSKLDATSEIESAANAPFVRAFMQKLPATEYGTLMGAGGKLSAAGLKRIQGALLAKAYGGNAQTNDLLNRTLEDLSDNARAISGAMLDAAPEFAQLREALVAGRVDASMDLAAPLMQALETLSGLRASGGNVASHLANADMFGRDPAVDEFLRAFYKPNLKQARSRAHLGEYLTHVAREAQSQGATGQMFDAVTDAAELLKQSRELLLEGRTEIAASAPPGWDAVEVSVPGLTVKQLRKILGPTLDRLGRETRQKIYLLEHAGQLPAHLLKEMGPNVEGLINMRTGEIWLIARNISSPKRAQLALAHELVGHLGLKKMLGTGKFNALVQSVRKARFSDPVIRETWAEAERRYPGEDSVTLAIEALAITAEKQPTHRMVERVRAAIRYFFRTQLELDLELTQNDLVYMLNRAAEKLMVEQGRRPKRPRSQVDTIGYVPSGSPSGTQGVLTTPSIGREDAYYGARAPGDYSDLLPGQVKIMQQLDAKVAELAAQARSRPADVKGMLDTDTGEIIARDGPGAAQTRIIIDRYWSAYYERRRLLQTFRSRNQSKARQAERAATKAAKEIRPTDEQGRPLDERGRPLDSQGRPIPEGQQDIFAQPAPESAPQAEPVNEAAGFQLQAPPRAPMAQTDMFGGGGQQRQERAPRPAPAGQRDLFASRAAPLSPEEALKQPTPPSEFYVYRAGTPNEGLGARNAGTLKGVANFLDWADEKFLGTADTVLKYKVTVPEGYRWGPYENVRGAEESASERAARKRGVALPKFIGRNDKGWLSFPREGVQAELVATYDSIEAAWAAEAPEGARRPQWSTDGLLASRPEGMTRDTTGTLDGTRPEQGNLVPPAPPGPIEGKVEAGGGTYALNSFKGLEAEAQRVLLQMLDLFDPTIAAQRGNNGRPISWDMEDAATRELLSTDAGQLLRGLVARDPRAAANAPTLKAYAQLTMQATQAVKDAARTYARSGSAQDLLALQRAKEIHGMLLAPTMGYFTEAGRALNVLRQVQGQMAEAEAIFEAMGDGTEGALREFARQVNAAPDTNAVLNRTRAAYQPTFLDQYREFWINSILSGPWTHAVNILSNLAYTGLEVGTELAASLVSPNVSTRAVLARLEGMMRGTLAGFVNGYKAFKTEQPQLDQQTQIESDKRQAIKGWLGRLIRIPGRLLMAEDEFAKAINYTGELYRLAMDEAQRRNPHNLGAEFDRVLAEYQGNEAAKKQAREHADRLTFQTPLGKLGKRFMQLRNELGPFGWIPAPFVKTPTNILKRAMEYTPTALAMPSVRSFMAESARNRDMAYARMAIGTSVMASVVGAVVNGMMTGAGPDDPRERALWMRQGKQPYSIKVGDKWIKYNRFEPVGMVLGIAADMAEIGATVQKGEYEKVGTMLLSSIMLNLADKTYLRGIVDLSQAMLEPKRYFAQWASDLALSNIPNVSAQVARGSDPFVREARTFTDKLKSRLPGLRQTLPAKLDVAGEPIANSTFEPARSSEARRDPLAETMGELGVFMGAPDRKIQLHGRALELDAAQYTAMKQAVQRARWGQLTPMVQSKGFRSLMEKDPARAAAALRNRYTQIGEAAKLKWMRDSGVLDELRAAPPKPLNPSNYIEAR